MQKIFKIICLFICCLVFAYPINNAQAEINFFEDIKINMSKSDVAKLGAKECGTAMCLDLKIEKQTFKCVFEFANKKLAAVVLSAKLNKENYLTISNLLENSSLVPIYLEVNNESCDLTELLKMGFSKEQALDKFLTLSDKLTQDSTTIMFYTDTASLDKLVAKKELLDNADIVAPNGPIAILFNESTNITLLYSQFALLNIL